MAANPSDGWIPAKLVVVGKRDCAEKANEVSGILLINDWFCAIGNNSRKLTLIKSKGSDTIVTDRQVNHSLMLAPSIVTPSVERLHGSLRIM